MSPRDPVSTAFIYGLGASVTLVWMASMIASILDHTYTTPVALHGLMGTVVGSVFADAGLRRARRQLRDERDDPDDRRYDK
jgi:tetrahydromethanopterin S-methyltransferase subunit C